MRTTSSGGRSSAPAITKAIAVCSPWYEPPPTRKNWATAAAPARMANVSQSLEVGLPLASAAAPA